MSRLRAFASVLLVVLFCFVCGSARADEPAAAEAPALPILGFDFDITKGPWTDVRPPVLSCAKPGEPARPETLRACLREAMDGGRFLDGSVSLNPQGAGVRVLLRLVPRKLLGEVRVDLHDTPIEQDELLRETDIEVGGEISPDDLDKRRIKIEEFLKRRGFPKPVVVLSSRSTNDEGQVVLLVDAAPGPPRLLSQRVFFVVGSRAEDVRPLTDAYAVKVRERADEVQLALADTQLELKLRGAGFFKATVSHEVKLDRGLVTLQVRVDSGSKIIPRFQGNEHFDADALTAALGIEDDADRSFSHLTSKLVLFYQQRGFLDVEVSAELRGDGDPRSHLVFKIRENERVRVGGRAYPCLVEAETKRLSDGGPRTAKAIGVEIDSFLDEELPGADLIRSPPPPGVDALVGSSAGTGTRLVPLELEPTSVYVAETYDRAAAHVQELYRAEGYLDARVGPVYVLRRQCDPKAPAGQCRPLPLPKSGVDVCAYDSTSLPLPVPPQDMTTTCVPDPRRGVTCESAVWLSIPVKLGPRSIVYDAAFAGTRARTEKDLFDAARLDLGAPANTIRIDEARRRVLDYYREEGFAFAEVRYSIESSPDHTRARVRFDVNELDQVLVDRIVVRGNRKTNLDAILRRVALEVGKPYRASDVRKTQERVATLGTFSSVNVALEDPYVPGRKKTVVITVAERLPQALEIRPGFSTDEGLRGAFEYTHVNLNGGALGFAFRAQLSYLPTVFMIDPVVRKNYGDLPIVDRLAARITASVTFPEIGLGPLVRATIDNVVAQDLQRDYTITKLAAIPSLNYRPAREWQFSAFQSLEYNDVFLFQSGSLLDYFTALSLQNRFNPDLVRQLNVPDGKSVAIAQRVVVTWDRRDNPFNATRGTVVVLGAEHVDAYPMNPPDSRFKGSGESHFFRLTSTLGGYIPLPRGMRIAAQLRLGRNVQLTQTSETYPDRLFFMGGVDSMRGWLANTFLPQDTADQVQSTSGLPDFVQESDVNQPCTPGDSTATCVPNPIKVTPQSRPVRGGNLFVNPRLEVRVPIRAVFINVSKSLEPFETVLFTDIGNLWVDPTYPFDNGKFPVRASVGTGVRFQTPIGPLAVDYGINVTRKAFEDFGNFHFAVGLF